MTGKRLEVRDLRVAYESDIEILRGVSLTAKEGSVTAVIGPNGAGKSTLLRAVAGVAPTTNGTVKLDGRPITRLSPARLVELGLAFVPQERTIFTSMSVRENLQMGGWRRRGDRRWLEQRIEEVCALFPMLDERLHSTAGDLSGGQQKTLELARGLVSEPTVLLLDEPTAGLSPKMAAEIYRQIEYLRAQIGVTIVLVEQNVREALALADHVYVLAMGRNDLDGTSEEIASNLDSMVRGWLQRTGSGVVASGA
jgi:branched-chain amino acid transport system ATP-binding protein